MASEIWRYVLMVEGRETELSDGEVTLGRSRTATVRVDHESVSRSHALLTFDQGKATVKDLNSSNGTFVSGRRILNETRLVDGDRIQLGAAVLEVRLIPPPGLSEKTAMIDPALLQPKPPPPPAEPVSPPGPADTLPGTPPPRPQPAAIAHDEVPAAPVPPPLPPFAVEPVPLTELSASDLFREVDRQAAVKKPEAPRAPSLSEIIETEIVLPKPPAAAGVDESALPRVEAHLREPLSRPDTKPAEPLTPDAPAAAPRELADVSLQMSSIPTVPVRPASSERAAAFVERRAPSTTDDPRNAARPLLRLVAALVDAIILSAFDLVGFSPVFLILFFRTEMKAREAGPDWLLFVVALLSSLVVLGFDLWYVVGGWAKRGRTPGKSLTGLALVRRGAESGQGIGWDAAFRRALYAFLGCLPLGAGFWVSFVRKDRRAWHDLQAETWVVKTR